MSALPLLGEHRVEAIVGFADREPVAAGPFLDEVALVAASLPDGAYVLNLCTDRYRFAVGLAAALTRGQITLLPPDQTPALIANLKTRYPDLYCLADHAGAEVALRRVAYPESEAREVRHCAGHMLQPEGAWSAPRAIPVHQPEQVVAHVFTSGSTGAPQPHAKTWGSLVQGSRAAGLALGIHQLQGASLLATVPAQHMYGLESSVLLPLQHGLALDSSRRLFPADITARLAELSRPRILVTTPVHLRALLAETGTLPPLDLVLCATAPLADELAQEAESRFCAPLQEIYGCTEAGQIAVRRTVRGPFWSPLPGIRLALSEAGVLASGGSVENPSLLQDQIELLPNGSFLLQGRNADLVNIAGKRTSLAYLNHQLHSIPGVIDGIFVMPLEAGDRVTRLLAFVVAPDLSDEELFLALRARIDSAFLPRPLCRVDSLPRNATGKLPQAALVRLVTESGAL
jgi:acyl-coenzyme A synthetase/AMP-(fatty) acid ligase